MSFSFATFFCRFTRTYQKVLRLVETLHYFTTRGWDFDSKGLIELWETTSEEDKKVGLSYFNVLSICLCFFLISFLHLTLLVHYRFKNLTDFALILKLFITLYYAKL